VGATGRDSPWGEVCKNEKENKNCLPTTFHSRWDEVQRRGNTNKVTMALLFTEKPKGGVEDGKKKDREGIQGDPAKKCKKPYCP